MLQVDSLLSEPPGKLEGSSGGPQIVLEGSSNCPEGSSKPSSPAP